MLLRAVYRGSTSAHTSETCSHATGPIWMVAPSEAAAETSRKGVEAISTSTCGAREEVEGMGGGGCGRGARVAGAGGG
eukprot:3645271-Prymnesium_polylepis.1